MQFSQSQYAGKALLKSFYKSNATIPVGYVVVFYSAVNLSSESRAGEAGSFALLWFECRMCGNANVPDCVRSTNLSGGNYTQRFGAWRRSGFRSTKLSVSTKFDTKYKTSFNHRTRFFAKRLLAVRSSFCRILHCIKVTRIFFWIDNFIKPVVLFHQNSSAD